MTQPLYKIVPLSESAVVVEFGRSISIDFNDKALNLAASLDAAPFPGYIESVPAYASTTVFYDPVAVRKYFSEFDCAFDPVAGLLNAKLSNAATAENRRKVCTQVEIPVDFNDEHALDLAEVCELTRLDRGIFIERFLARTYRVYMLGFLPGFAYMGEVDQSIAVPRKETPRTKVPKGSVGIAGKQTGIYPLESPGGWQIIGRVSVEMFKPNAERPCLLNPGDEVKFVQSD